MEKEDKIYIAGHNGMVGSAIVRKLQKEGFVNIITKSSLELDLTNQIQVNEFFKIYSPKYVILAAAKVGGIMANNTYKADFIYKNLMIEANVIHAAYLNKVTKLLFLGSSCIYPKNAKQPLKEEYLLSGYLEETNKPYAIAKIAGIELCQSYNFQYGCKFISAMPTNLYGTNDNYDLKTSHVLPALIRKFIEAKKNNVNQIEIWGTGNVKREFMHVDDLADACVFLMNNYEGNEIINIGWGLDITIKDLANLIGEIISFNGNLIFNNNIPDGTFQKLLDVSRITNLGWTPKIHLKNGIERTINEMYNIL